MQFLFWVLYVIAWAGGFYFNPLVPTPGNRVINIGWTLPLILIGILGYAVFHLPH